MRASHEEDACCKKKKIQYDIKTTNCPSYMLLRNRSTGSGFDSVSEDLVGGAHDPFLAEYYVEEYSPLRRRLRWYERVSNWFEQKFLGHEFIQ